MGELSDAGPWLAKAQADARELERGLGAIEVLAKVAEDTVERLMAEAEPWVKAVQDRDARYLEAKEEARELAKDLAEMGKSCDLASEMMAAKRKSADEELAEMAKRCEEAAEHLDYSAELLQLIYEHNPDLRLPSPEALKFRDYYKAVEAKRTADLPGPSRDYYDANSKEAKGAPVPPEDGGPYCGACDGTREVAEHKLSAIDGFSIPQRTGEMIACPTCRPAWLCGEDCDNADAKKCHGWTGEGQPFGACDCKCHLRHPQPEALALPGNDPTDDVRVHCPDCGGAGMLRDPTASREDAEPIQCERCAGTGRETTLALPGNDPTGDRDAVPD